MIVTVIPLFYARNVCVIVYFHFFDFRIIVAQFNKVALKTPGQMHHFLKTLRENAWFSKLTFAMNMILEVGCIAVVQM